MEGLVADAGFRGLLTVVQWVGGGAYGGRLSHCVVEGKQWRLV